MIEKGPGWLHVIIVALNVGPTDYLLSVTKTAVDSGGLLRFANSSAEQAYFASNTVLTLFTPIWTADDAGYNSGNLLIGL